MYVPPWLLYAMENLFRDKAFSTWIVSFQNWRID